MAKIDWEKDKQRRMASGATRYAPDPDGTGGRVAPSSGSYDHVPEESKWMGGEKEPESSREVYDYGGPEKKRKGRQKRWKKVRRQPGMVECPVCPACCKEKNLQSHIRKIHGPAAVSQHQKATAEKPRTTASRRSPERRPADSKPVTPRSEKAKRPAHIAVRDAARDLGIDLPALIAQVALWAPVHEHRKRKSDENPTGAVYPKVRRARIGTGEKPGQVVGGIRLDRNNYANEAVRRALGLHKRRGDGYQACHIWPDSCYDERYHTVLANLVLIPGPLVSLTDFDQDVIAALQYRSFELFGWHPLEEELPEPSASYPNNWREPSPPRKPQRRLAGATQAPKAKGSKKSARRQVDRRGRGHVSQRDIMRQLWRQYRGDATAIIRAWARAERSGEAVRASNVRGLSPEDYGRRLLDDGIKKGWISD